MPLDYILLSLHGPATRLFTRDKATDTHPIASTSLHLLIPSLILFCFMLAAICGPNVTLWLSPSSHPLPFIITGYRRGQAEPMKHIVAIWDTQFATASDVGTHSLARLPLARCTQHNVDFERLRCFVFLSLNIYSFHLPSRRRTKGTKKNMCFKIIVK